MAASAPPVPSPASDPDALVPAPEPFVGRQPIFDRKQEAFGYDLLYRAGPQDLRLPDAADPATLPPGSPKPDIPGFFDLIGARKAFVTITRQLLLDSAYAAFPVKRVVIELRETVAPDPAVVAACAKLKDTGYLLGLGGFAMLPGYEPLLDLADFIRIDFQQTPPNARDNFARQYAGCPLRLIAEKVATPGDFAQAAESGYALFQGNFFLTPHVVAGAEIAVAKRAFLRFLCEINRPTPDYGKVNQAINSDATLSQKLLRYINSPALGLTTKVRSIRDGLGLLGDRGLRRWGTVVVATSLGQDKPAELALTCLARARFCELIAPHLGLTGSESDLFLMGVLSAGDALLDQPLTSVLTHLSPPAPVIATLLGGHSPLTPAYLLALTCERGVTAALRLMLGQTQLTEDQVYQIYRDALLWADRAVASA